MHLTVAEWISGFEDRLMAHPKGTYSFTGRWSSRTYLERGGFDVVLGNPPWDQVQLDPREFFATRDISISNQPNMAARNQAIQLLATTNPPLYN